MIAGNARISRNEVTKVIQVNNGIRINDMPGARRLMIVTMKFNAAAIELTPRIWRPSTQKSIRTPGEYWVDVRFA